MSKESNKTDDCSENLSNIADAEFENASDVVDVSRTGLKRNYFQPESKTCKAKEESKDAKSSNKRVGQKLWLSWTSARKKDRNVFTG